MGVAPILAWCHKGDVDCLFMEIKEMTKTLTTGILYGKACDIEDYAQARPLLNTISAAQENANDTHAGQEVTEEEWEVTAWASLEFNLCYETDENICVWFKAQGVRW